MDARIDHVVDSRDTRPAFQITYRRFSDTRASHVRIQADDVNQAMQALTEYIGNTQYAVTAIGQEVRHAPAVVAEVDVTEDEMDACVGTDERTIYASDDQGMEWARTVRGERYLFEVTRPYAGAPGRLVARRWIEWAQIWDTVRVSYWQADSK